MYSFLLLCIHRLPIDELKYVNYLFYSRHVYKYKRMNKKGGKENMQIKVDIIEIAEYLKQLVFL